MKRCVLCGDTFLSADWNCPDCGGAPPRHKTFLAFAPESAECNDGFSSAYFSRLADLETGHFWFEGRNQVILWGLRRYARDARSLMEVGCGTGVVLQAVHRNIPGMHLCGSEIFSDGLSFAAQRLPEADLMQMDARKMPFDVEFDAIGLFDVLEHIEEDRVVLGEVWRSLKPGGCVLITVPQHPSLWSAVDEHSYHKRRYTAKDLTSKLVEAGFEIVHVTSFMTLLLPIFVLSRWRYRRLGRELSAGQALEIHSLLNGLFSKILSCERLLIQLGLKLPAGGSLFAVARRPSAADR